jgi:hypothetical protein
MMLDELLALGIGRGDLRLTRVEELGGGGGLPRRRSRAGGEASKALDALAVASTNVVMMVTGAAITLGGQRILSRRSRGQRDRRAGFGGRDARQRRASVARGGGDPQPSSARVSLNSRYRLRSAKSHAPPCFTKEST